jgi:hypothetical protein
MKYTNNDPYITFENILELKQNGGRAMITVDNYNNTGVGHAMTVKKVLYVPNKRFDIKIFDPNYNNGYLIRNFNKGASIGQNLRFWFIKF